MDGSFEDHHYHSNSGSFVWTPRRPSDVQEEISSPSNHRDAPTSSKAEPKSLSAPPSRPSLDPDSLPGARKSLGGISLRAFLLGQVFGVGVLLTAYFLYVQQPLWRLPFFFVLLSLFHFLEFWITARYNTRYATVSAFLLSSNGTAYNLAQMSAVLECLIKNLLVTRSEVKSSEPWSMSFTIVGIIMTAIGQTTRSLAMAHAGTNFNHRVQTKRSDEHQLVTTGIYAHLRHPSYFGFFWWALGAQVMLGNKICFSVYALVLWRFFRDRIKKEEEFLVRFFGQEYLDYRQRTKVGIPFIK